MPQIRVETPSAQYTVHLGSGLLLNEWRTAPFARLPHHPSRVVIVTSREIDTLWGGPVRQAVTGMPVHTLYVPAGEQHKRLSTIERLCEELAALGADRDTLLVALGGGVIGDMTGFLAAVYMRGLHFIQVPTTLLAQVDSSVGGKTGVNLAAGKNLVGSFHQPLVVLADLDTLRTLPERELRAGLQESVKSAIIRDAALFDYMEAHADAVLAGDPVALERVIEASIRVKAAVVAEDEHEGGLRMILNFGHTVGHAIEAATEYKQLLHGEAIGWGMLAAISLAAARGVLSDEDAHRMRAVIRRYTALPPFTASAERLIALTGSDKKKRSGALSFILPVAIGQVEIVRDVTETELTTAVEAMLHEVRAAAPQELAMPVETPHEVSTGARPEGTRTIAEASRAVQQMFDTIAPRYDRLNHVLSFGMDRVWWNRASRFFDATLKRPESNVLDLCCGTADMTAALLARRPHTAHDAPITAIDFSHEMIERGRAKLAGKAVSFIEADALALPLADASQDLVVSAFGFRNLADYDAGLCEIRRVLRPGGQIGILDFSTPPGLLGTAYRLYFQHVLPRIGGIISGSGASYRYLPASVERFPSPVQMCQKMTTAGFTQTHWKPYLFGVAGLWSGVASR